MAELTFAEISQLLKYDPETGKLFWLSRPVHFFVDEAHAKTWNTRYSGTEAFTAINITGYKKGGVFDSTQLAHRVAWCLFYKKWPEGPIDHINGIPDDNRIENLRMVSHRENSRNKCLDSRNKSGAHGVCWSNKKRRWIAKIGIDCKSIRLGAFINLEDAIAARKAAETKYGFHENHGREFMKRKRYNTA